MSHAAVGTAHVVLLVDDSRELLDAGGRALERAGYVVLKADSGQAALELAASHAVDVAVVDYHMPPPDGLQVLAVLAREAPTCVRVLISGELKLDLAVAAVNQCDVSQVLPKPFTAGELLAVVATGLRRRALLASQLTRAQAQAHEAERSHLLECLHGDSLSLALQPIVATSDRALFAHECLLRSVHPALRSPADLLPAAERQDLVQALTMRVAELAAGWLVRLDHHSRLFVNLHPLDLAQPETLCDRLAPLLPFAGRVVLEITEQSSARAIEGSERSLDLLRQSGFELAVDDLGSGYSSLLVLAQVEPRYVKIDMGIVRDVDTHATRRRLVELICQFAEAIQCMVVAEGVETAAEAATLTSAGVHLLQGYFIGRPAAHPASPAGLGSSLGAP